MTISIIQMLRATVEPAPGEKDWITLLPVGGTWTEDIPWSYVSKEPLDVAVPATPGQYEFVLYRNDGFEIIEKSVPITVASDNLLCIFQNTGTISGAA